ncbi:MAG: hypothetical protein AAGF73_18230 [Actinomycetota bacterium]
MTSQISYTNDLTLPQRRLTAPGALLVGQESFSLGFSLGSGGSIEDGASSN